MTGVIAALGLSETGHQGVEPLGLGLHVRRPANHLGEHGEALDLGDDARAKKYLDEWAKYEKELAAWKKQQKEGKKAATTAPAATTQQVRQTEATDPITGTWRAAITGAPLPGPTSFTFAVTLDGTRVEGRVLDPPEAAGRLTGTFDGKRFTGQVEVDIEGLGFPQIDATLDRPDHMEGTIGIGELTINFEAERIEKKAVEFKVVQRRVRGKDDRPEPPKKDEALEPLRRVLEKKIPVMVNVQTPAQIAAVLEVVTKDYEVLAVLLNAEGARLHAETLAKNGIGVIVPPSVLRTLRNQPYHQSDDLARRGVSVAFQSDAEDGARSLRALALYAVERGLSAEAALAALTVDAAKMLAIDDRVGSLAAGKDGDLVIFDGHPLEAGTAVLRVVIDGREVPQ